MGVHRRHLPWYTCSHRVGELVELGENLQIVGAWYSLHHKLQFVYLYLFRSLARNAKQAVQVRVVQVPPLHVSFINPSPLCSHCHWSLLLSTAVSTFCYQEQMGYHQPISLQTCSQLSESSNSPSPLLNLCLQSGSILWPSTLLAVLKSYSLMSCRVAGGFLIGLCIRLGWGPGGLLSLQIGDWVVFVFVGWSVSPLRGILRGKAHSVGEIPDILNVSSSWWASLKTVEDMAIMVLLHITMALWKKKLFESSTLSFPLLSTFNQMNGWCFPFTVILSKHYGLSWTTPVCYHIKLIDLNYLKRSSRINRSLT